MTFTSLLAPSTSRHTTNTARSPWITGGLIMAAALLAVPAVLGTPQAAQAQGLGSCFGTPLYAQDLSQPAEADTIVVRSTGMLSFDGTVGVIAIDVYTDGGAVDLDMLMAALGAFDLEVDGAPLGQMTTNTFGDALNNGQIWTASTGDEIIGAPMSLDSLMAFLTTQGLSTVEDGALIKQ